MGAGGELIARKRRANDPSPALSVPGRTLDIHGIDAWLVDSLREFAASGKVARIVTVGHGAGCPDDGRGHQIAWQDNWGEHCIRRTFNWFA